ncbi:MAG TPA: DUF58 domain-containing protein [Terriglobia bacterium]|nr:DUF58 domain-containing protein [Terriglobia bacterium]
MAPPDAITPPAEVRESATDWPAWQRFLLALVGLGLALLLALEATALRQTGRYALAAASAVTALGLAAAVAVGTIPYLARRTVLSRLILRIEYDFTRTGAVYVLLMFSIGLAAVNTGNNLLYLVLAVLLAGVLVSGAVSRLMLGRLEIELELPEHIFARRPAPARLTLHNRKSVFASFAVTLAPPRDRRRARDDSPLTRREGQVVTEPVFWEYLPPLSAAVRHLELTFPARGRYAQEGFRLATRFPFGLLVKARRVPLRREVIVLPAIEPTAEFYEVLPLVTGEVETLAKGRGHDLYAIRDYHASDAARHVDWKATARSQRLKVREFTREDERRVILVLDPHLPAQGAAERARFEKAVHLCACLAWHFYEIGAELQFVTQGSETRMGPSGSVIYPALERLALIEPSADAGFLGRLPLTAPGFRIILTGRARGSIASGLWSTSYIVFFDSL